MFNVSQSKVKTFLKCRQQYHYKYVEKLRKRKKSRPLQFGSMVHSMIEAYANGDDPFQLLKDWRKTQGKMFREQIEEYGDILEDLRLIMEDYFDHYDERELVYLRRKRRSSEHEFSLEIASDIMMVGKIDAFARTQNGLRWIVEHKTFTHMPNEDQRWRSVQSAVYNRVTELLGWFEIDGICWDYIRSKSPSKPQFLKNGKLGKRAVDSLPSAIREFLEDHDLKEKDHKELLLLVKKNRDHYFRRVFNPTKRDVVDMVWEDFVDTAKMMRDQHGKFRMRTIDQHCSWCDYEDLCRAELTGSDVDFLKEKYYATSGS